MGLRLFRAWPYRACVLIQVFTGTVPFSGKPETAAVFEIMNGDRPPRPTHPTIAERLWSLMKLCWDNEPHLRPEISKVLETLLAASASCLFCDYRVSGLTVVFCSDIPAKGGLIARALATGGRTPKSMATPSDAPRQTGLPKASPSSPSLQKLHNLEMSSPNFQDQLSDAFYGKEYAECVRNLEGDDLTWLINYLDKVRHCLPS